MAPVFYLKGKIMGTQVRVLCQVTADGTTYQPNQVVELPARLAKTLAAEGQVDANVEAVAYAINELGAPPIAHVADGDQAAADDAPAA